MAKQSNKRKKKTVKDEEIISSQMSLKSMIVIILCVCVVFFGFYLFTLYMTKQDQADDSSDSSQEVQFSDDTILLGQALSMSPDHYYVLFYDFSDEEHSSNYSNKFSEYQNKEDALPIYSVDLSSGFNKKYVTDGESNKNPSSAEEFAIKGVTLIEVVNHSVADYLEGEEEILNALS